MCVCLLSLPSVCPRLAACLPAHHKSVTSPYRLLTSLHSLLVITLALARLTEQILQGERTQSRDAIPWHRKGHREVNISHRMTALSSGMMSFPACGTSLPTWASSRKFPDISLIIVTIASFSFLQAVKAFHCKFPNEGCDVNNGHECCSGKCVDLHPGTNARCTRLSLHKPCLYTYQCDDRLRCGSNNTCCAKYWGTCTRAEDCCDPDHQCFEIEGFYYKRCLYPSQTAAFIHAQSSFPAGLLRKWHQLSFVVLMIVTISVNFALNRQLNSLWRTLIFL